MNFLTPIELMRIGRGAPQLFKLFNRRRRRSRVMVRVRPSRRAFEFEDRN